MSRQLANYVSRYAPATPRPAAYAFIVRIEADFHPDGTTAGALVVNIYESNAEFEAGADPIDVLRVVLGQIVVPAAGETPAVRTSTLDELLMQAPFGAAFGTIRGGLYLELDKLPQFQGAVDVP